MFQFFVEEGQVRNGLAYIKDSDVNHIRNVLRLKEGDRVQIVSENDLHLFLCTIQSEGENEIVCRVDETVLNETELPSRIYLFQGLPKSDKMEWIIQKAVELGVYEIIPVRTENAVVKLDAKKAAAKVTRWQTIAETAAKQTKRSHIPVVGEVMDFKDALHYMQDMDHRFMAYEKADAEGMDETRRLLSSVSQGQSAAIFIGPEGGFSPEEVNAAADAQVERITLGRRILRTETAGMTLLSWFVYLLEK